MLAGGPSDSRFASAVKKEDRKNSAEPTRRIHNDHASSMSDGAPERDSVIQLERKSVMGRSPTEAEMSRAFSKKRPALGYWDNRGIAEPIRLLLHYVGVEFDDVRFDVGPPPAYDKSDWLLVKDHLGLSAPNLPYWIEPGGLRLTQSHAITLYLAQKHGVDGESAAVRGRAIMAHECVRDCVSAFMAVTYCNAPGYCDAAEDGVHAAGALQAARQSARFNAKRDAYLKEKLPTHLDTFTTMLRHGATGWVAGSAEPTYADLCLGEALDQHLIFTPHCLDAPAHEPLRAFMGRFRGLPAVAAYHQSERFKAEPLHNRYAHFHCGWLHSAEKYYTQRHYTPRSAGEAKKSRRRELCRDILALVLLLGVLGAMMAVGRTAIEFHELEEHVEQEAACAADLPMCNMTGCCCPSPANFVDAGGISLESASGI